MDDSVSVKYAAQEDQEGKQDAVRLLVLVVVCRIAKEAKSDLDVSLKCAITDHFFNKIWPQVKNMEFELSPDFCDYFEQTVYEQLFKYLGSEQSALYCMMSDYPPDFWVIIDFFLRVLKPQSCDSKPCKVKNPKIHFLENNWKTILLTTVCTVGVAACIFGIFAMT